MGVLDVGRQPEDPTEDLLADETRVVGGATGRDPHPADGRCVGVVELDVLEPHGSVLVQTAGERLGHHRSLLVDLLEHEVLVSALLGLLGVPRDVRDLPLDRRTVDRLDRRTVLGDHDQLVVLDDEEVAGVVQHCGYVRGEEGLPLAESHDERADLPHGDDLARLVLGHHDHRIGAL